MTKIALMTLGAALNVLAMGGGEVYAQTDLNAGKSAAQMFASNCAACHRSPAGLARSRNPYSVANFLTQHYTARPDHARAIASYIISVRGSAPPQRASTPDPAAVPTARHRPLDKIANATVERLKSFATAADVAVPPDPQAPPRGVKQLEVYAATGTGPTQLRQTAISAAMRQARGSGTAPAAGPGSGAAADGEATKDGAAAATATPPATEGAAVLQLRGPPTSGASPSRQSNSDQF
ncbi:MAG: hypothetical protein R3D62_09780 [Xanthobacteraceae bacterium]